MVPHPQARAALAALAFTALAATGARAAWGTHGGNAQHTALSTVPAQPLQAIRWQTPVDLQPQYSGNLLFIHYGSPLVTEGNTVIFPVKLGVTDTFRVEARAAAGGALLWQLDTDYTLPPHSWTPSVTPVRSPGGRLYVPAAGGTLLWTSGLDTPGAHTGTRLAFFGDAAYAANVAAMNASLKVSSPLTCGDNGSVWFTVRAVTANPLGITNGLATVDASGAGRFVSASDASGGLANQFALNCAPALSRDGSLVYVAARGSTSAPGYLLAISTATLATRALVAPLDPSDGLPVVVSTNSTSSAMVAPDGRVYFGVLGSLSGTNPSRGWMLQYDSLLVSSGAPGAFGWDHTPSLVPISMVPGYAGSSPYLIMTKYNNYAGFNGDGVNRIAVLDPGATQTDAVSGVTVMREIRTIAGVTPDPDQGPSYPNAVKEWCINTAATDPFTNSVFAGNEDGVLYRWDLSTNTFTESIVLTPGVGEAYTPTVVGPDGQVYAINNATLFAVGATNVSASPPAAPAPWLALAGANPAAGEVRLRYALPVAARVTLEIFDVAGRREAVLDEGLREPGSHEVRWDGRLASGAAAPTGLHLVRLRTEPGGTRSLRLMLVH